ncbi:MAG: hypothetical protein JWM41_761 [Gemmatimonadetes bacterium]|nr:hypothetical protein [Gemmatimonadota bacterium]
MRSTILLAAAVAATAIAACSSSGVKVRTTAEPGANLSGLHSFYVLAPPARSGNATPLSVNDPMLENSITNRQLRADLTQAFQSRGYASAPRQSADFVVAYYAGTKEKFDTTYWGPAYDPGWRYSYWGRRNAWAWPYYGGGYRWDNGGVSVNSYTQGQVIVDVTDPRSQQLLWRGQGVEPVSSDPATYTSAMQKVVNAIVAKFPQGSASAVVGAR